MIRHRIGGTARVLVTGASGFVGRQTLQPLQRRGFEVHAIGRGMAETRGQRDLHWHATDLLVPAERRALIADVRPQIVLHCAWVTAHGRFWSAAENLDWVGASLDLLRGLVEAGCNRAVLVGSCAEYDWLRDDAAAWRETDPCRPASLYGSAKQALHHLATSFAATSGFELAWARLFYLLGPHEPAARLMPSLLRALREGRRFSTGPGARIRDWLDSRDAGAALAALVDCAATGPFNVASGRGLSVADLAYLAADAAERRDLLDIGALAASAEPEFMLADITKLHAATGWSPEHPLESTIAELWAQTPEAHFPNLI